MKNKYLSLLALVFLAMACTKPDDILDDFQVHISPTFYSYVVELEIEDLVDPATPISGNVSVSILGEDADLIHNIDGTKDYQVNFGTLQLMIPRNSEPTLGNPINFKVRFQANNYQPTEVSFNINEGDFFQADVARMLNLTTLPSSAGSKSATGGIDPTTNTLAAPLVVNAGSQDSVARIKITIPTDVKFLDADGNEIVAKKGGTGLNVNVLSLSDSSEAAQQAMPNGTGLIQLVDNPNGGVDTLLLEQGGTFNINMDLDGTPVRGFSGGKTSGGVTTRFPVTADAYNAEFDRPYQEGDSISLMSLSEGDGSWANDGRSYVVKKDPVTNELYVDGNIQHLSWWRWYWRWWYRPVYYTRGIGAYFVDANNQPSGFVSGRVTGRLSYFRYGRWRSCYLYIRGNFGPNWASNPRRYYRSTSPYNPAIMYSNFSPSIYNFSVENRGVYRVLKIQAKQQPVSIGYRLFCKGSNTLVDPPAGVRMFYRQSGTGDGWATLYTFTSQNAGIRFTSFPQLQNNTTYDFRAQWGDVTKDTANVQVIDGRIYDVTLPAGACNALGL